MGHQRTFSRRTLFKGAAAGAAGLALTSGGYAGTTITRVPWAWRALGARAATSPQVLLPASSIPQFVDPLPGLSAMGLIPAGAEQFTLRIAEFQAQPLPSSFKPTPTYTGTWVWGYLSAEQASRTTHIGPVIVATRGTPTAVKWANTLGSAVATNVLAYRYSTDQTLHWADPVHDEANAFAHTAGVPAFGSARADNYAGSIPAVTHLHGGEVPPALDGGPDAWYTADGAHHGHAYYTGPSFDDDPVLPNEAVYRYPNSQEAAPIWFHDHTLGATRLNVFAGLAGAYLIKDPNRALPAGLGAIGLRRDNSFEDGTDDAGIFDPAVVDPIIPLVIQDRSFDTNGQFFLPADTAGGMLWSPNPEHPYWVPEFVGDTILVNGKVWPYLGVDRQRYRFLFLNGSNARTYEMFLTDPKTKVNGPPLWVIGTDGGYLDAPVKIDPNAPKGQLQRLVMMPGERYDVIIDFNDPTWLALNPNFSGSLILMNTAKTPYPSGGPPQGSTVGRIMQFRVSQSAPPDGSYNPAAGVPLRPPMIRLANPVTGTLSVTPALTRQLTLNEVMAPPKVVTDPVTGAPNTAYPGGPLEILVNNTKWSGERVTGVAADGMYIMQPISVTDPNYFVPDGTGENFVSELPNEGATELWEIVNTTADAHPIHLHLVQFQIVNRQNYNTSRYAKVYAAAFPGGYDYVAGTTVPGGVYIPAYGPPLSYGPSAQSGNKYGGNPDITPYLQGPAMPPAAYEAGWKDTVIAYPGQVTRIVVRWAPTDKAVAADATDLVYPFEPNGGHGYVWHCHIIDHEDNEMMRPDLVMPQEGADRSYVKGMDY